ncbi:MAG: DUF3858 domain-containing protein, partial [Planctomycetes bacterium]|nr:DUF3858 domain-containing protein [Planctomycetota bacterium]
KASVNRWEGSIALDVTGKATMKASNSPLGHAGSIIRTYFDVEGQQKNTFDSFIGEFAPGAATTKVETSKLDDLNTPAKISVEVTLTGLGQAGNSGLTFPAHFMSTDYTRTALGYLDSRTTDMILPRVDGEKSSITLEAPEGMKPGKLPESISFKGKHVEYSLSFELKDKNIVVKRELYLHGSVVEVADFKTFRENLVKAAKADQTLVEFVKE